MLISEFGPFRFWRIRKQMIELRIESNRIDDLLRSLSESTSGSEEEICKARIVREVSDRKVGFFVYENYYFRTRSTVTGSVFLYQTDSNSCQVIIVGSGGASALGTTWGAHKDIENKIASAILDFAKETGMKAHQV